jgi:hypothetical protein
MPEVKSVNLLVVDFWSRLWANSFLLHKPHYFPSHTYEGRLNTALKGEWDLLGGLIAVSLPDRDRHIAIDKHFTLVDTRSPYFVRARVGEGWYDGERLPRANLRWRWTKGNAELLIENPHPRSLDVGFRFPGPQHGTQDIGNLDTGQAPAHRAARDRAELGQGAQCRPAAGFDRGRDPVPDTSAACRAQR